MNDDYMNFVLETYTLNSTNITISLDTLHGESDLYVKKCKHKDYESCKIGYKEIRKC